MPKHTVDEAKAIATLQAAIRHPSITGSEADFASYLADVLRELGMEVIVCDFLPGRPNVVAVRRGTGGGKCLLLAGHTDVVHVRGWRERWAGDPREDPFGAAIVDGAIWGRGSADLIAGIAMAIETVRALKDENLPGDIILAFVGTKRAASPGRGSVPV
jgi:acetylornithine deacetylase